MAHIEILNLEKSFGDTPVLRGIDLSIAPGEFVAILGPSGCGKSTLLRIVAGLETHDDGHVLMDGQVVDAMAPKQRDVAVVFQSYALYPHMTVAQNLSLPLVMRDLTRIERLPFVRHVSGRVKRVRRAIRESVERAAAQVEIASLLDRKPQQLSGGQRQRVALARALIRQPKLFLLDEPLSNLDATLRASTRAEIVQLQRKLGTTAIYVTHDQTEAMTMADRIAIMIEGQVVQIGTAREIYHRPSDVRAALFIGSPKMNLFEGMVEQGCVRLTATGSIVARTAKAHDGPVRVGIRPEHIALASGSDEGGPGANMDALPVVVTHQEFLGSEALTHVSLTGAQAGTGAVVRVDSEAIDRLDIGQQAAVCFHPDKLHVFGNDGKRLALVPSQEPSEPGEAIPLNLQASDDSATQLAGV